MNFDNFVIAPPSTDPAQQTLISQSFSQPAPGGLPAGWQQSTIGTGNFQVSTALSLTNSGALTIANADGNAIQAWNTTSTPADVDVTSAIYVNSLVPSEILARGQNLGTATPSYYAVTVTRGLELQLIRVVNGQSTVLETLDTQQWMSGQWINLTLSLRGDELRVSAYRNDTGEYLGSDGTWQVTPQWAMDTTDSALTNGGLTGAGREAGYWGTATFDSFNVSTPVTSTPANVLETFDTTPVGSMPGGWGQYSTDPTPSFSVSNTMSSSGSNSLSSDGNSSTEARAYLLNQQNADTQVAANVYLGSLVPITLFARGTGVDTATPTYYGVSVTRGVGLQLVQVVNGQVNVLSTLQSNDWVTGVWAHVSLQVQGDTLQIQLQRQDTGQYLTQDGNWQSDPTIAISATDGAITGAGYAGVERPASYSGPVYVDDFAAAAVPQTAPAGPPPVTGTNPVTPPTTTPPVGTTPTGTPPPVTTPPVTTPPVTNPTSTSLPAVPQHYPWIRVAELAYAGTPLDSTAVNLLQNSVDLVIPNTTYVNAISAIAPNTPQMLYDNSSNIYGNLLTDWNTYADNNNISREDAFYHVNTPTPFTGDSASSVPVNWFWSVQEGSDGNWTDLTSQAHSGGVPNLTFAQAGQSLAIGNTEQFREINVNMISGAGNGWSGKLQYATATDANGNPTSWKNLNTITDGTNGFTQSGQITFDPPPDWTTASINGSAKFYYVRVLTTNSGTAPVASTILGRDYLNTNGTDSGVIPVFDYAADKNHDGYLDDAEWANRKPGDNARFVYESRELYPNYGQNRFATNVANPAFQAWAADYAYRFLQANPNAGGIFMDNSLSKISIDPSTINESLDNYAANYANLLAGINAKIAPKWVLANVAGGGVTVNALASVGVSTLDEAVIRPMAASWSQFEDVASNLATRLSLSGGNAYEILDSLAPNGSMADPRVQIGTLAYYYLLANPTNTMLMFNGGNDPSSTWANHFSAAVGYNVGTPQGTWSVYDQGQDPADPSKTYKVYERNYSNAMILYKPLSYYRGVAGTTNNNTATVEQLGGTYRPLNADGTLGAPITQISLRNGEGAILVKA